MIVVATVFKKILFLIFTEQKSGAESTSKVIDLIFFIKFTHITWASLVMKKETVSSDA